MYTLIATAIALAGLGWFIWYLLSRPFGMLGDCKEVGWCTLNDEQIISIMGHPQMCPSQIRAYAREHGYDVATVSTCEKIHHNGIRDKSWSIVVAQDASGQFHSVGMGAEFTHMPIDAHRQIPLTRVLVQKIKTQEQAGMRKQVKVTA